MRKTLALLLLVSLPALGQVADVGAPVPAPAPSGLGQLLLSFVSPGGVGAVLGMVLSLVGGFAVLTRRRKLILASVFHRAFQGVEDIANSDDVEDGFDKTAAFLKEVDARLVAAGWRPLKPEEQVLAKLEASSLHGAEVAKAKVAAAAAEAAAVATAELARSTAPTPPMRPVPPVP